MNLANAGTASAYNVGNAQARGALDSGQARASGYVGQANALGGALSSIGQAAASFPLMQAQIGYLNQGAPGGGVINNMSRIPRGAYSGIGG